jgi:phytoene synthase
VNDLDVCRRTLRAGSKSFAAAALLLPRRVRDAATALYAFCRVADDLVDVHGKSVDVLYTRLERAYADRELDDPIDRAFSRTVHAFSIPADVPRALLEGMEWDVAGRRYEDLDGVEAYSARVAASVGVMMTLVMGRREPTTLARACDLGVAMQLTNIARDVGEDARAGRLYLPRAWMRDAGIDPDAFLARPEPSDRTAHVIARLLQAAERLYARADSGVGMLPRDCRFAIRAARLIYSDIGRVIARAGHDSITRRAVVSKGRKLHLLGRALVTSARGTGADDPPLAATRFLVEQAS